MCSRNESNAWGSTGHTKGETKGRDLILCRRILNRGGVDNAEVGDPWVNANILIKFNGPAAPATRTRLFRRPAFLYIRGTHTHVVDTHGVCVWRRSIENANKGIDYFSATRKIRGERNAQPTAFPRNLRLSRWICSRGFSQGKCGATSGRDVIYRGKLKCFQKMSFEKMDNKIVFFD